MTTLAERVGRIAAAEESARAEAFRRIKADSLRWVRLCMPDLHGVLRAKIVPASRFAEVARDGHPWGARLLVVDLREQLDPDTEYPYVYRQGNCQVLPDCRTFKPLPWVSDTAMVICDPYFVDGTPAVAPRLALMGALEQAAALGLRPVFGSELEFVIYRRDGDTLHPLTEPQHFFSIQGLTRAAPVLKPLFDHLVAMEFPVQDIENEGGLGQFELNCAPGEGLLGIDNLVMIKAAIKEILLQNGFEATFMTKADNAAETNTNGYHLHQSLLDGDGTNLFFDSDAPDGLSLLLRHYVAGQLAHAPALTVLGAPTITGYKRYQPGTWAPNNSCWGFDDRRALLRVPPERGHSTRIETRIAEAAANPYLLSAGLLLAGLDGISRRLEPGPLIGEAPLPSSSALPATLEAGLAALQADTVLCHALGPELARMYGGVLRSALRRFRSHVTDWEIAEYREML